MEAVIGICAAVLVGIQAHRNFLIIKGHNKPVVVPQVSAQAPDVHVNVNIDYDRLASALAKQDPVVVYVQQEAAPVVPAAPKRKAKAAPAEPAAPKRKITNEHVVEGVAVGRRFPARSADE